MATSFPPAPPNPVVAFSFYGGTDTGSDLGFSPFSQQQKDAARVWLDSSVPSELVNVMPGTFAFATMVHEIGHSLGLGHPGNYNAGDTGM